MVLDLEDNPNCDSPGMMRFREVGPARTVNRMKIYDNEAAGEWIFITGLSDQGPCQAYARPVEDSGAGVSILLYGGNWGIRFKRSESEPWDLSAAGQWGAAYLLLGDPSDLE